MKYIEHKGYKLFPIGIGTWGIGGFATKNPENDDQKQIEALVYMFKRGMNYLDINGWYAEGHSIKLVKQALALSNTSRESLFITLKAYPFTAKNTQELEEELLQVLKVLEIDYVDAIEYSNTTYEAYGINECDALADKLIQDGKTKYINITNSNKSQLERFYNRFESKVFANEIGFNFEVRENLDNGVIDYAISKDFLNVVFQPTRRNRTAIRKWQLLTNLEKKYGYTTNQIILSWILSKGFMPLIKSETIAHIDEALNSLDLILEPSDIKLIDEFRPPNYVQPRVFYELTGEGARIDQLSNVFDEEYDKQQLK